MGPPADLDTLSHSKLAQLLPRSLEWTSLRSGHARTRLLAGRHAATWVADTSTSVEFSSYKYPLTLSLPQQVLSSEPINILYTIPTHHLQRGFLRLCIALLSGQVVSSGLHPRCSHFIAFFTLRLSWCNSISNVLIVDESNEATPSNAHPASVATLT